jgi:3-oxoacyl-[acyl-carrier-protein] synthase II
MNRRVVITGIGMVTPLGVGKAVFGRHLFDGAGAIAPISAFDAARFASRLGAEVTQFDPKPHISLKNLRKMDRLSRMVAASARMAVDDAGFAVTGANRDRVGIVLGTSFGSTDVAVQIADVLFDQGPALVNPILVPNSVMNAPAGHTAIELGFRGINATVNHHEASAETAIAYAAAEIRRGRADAMLAGGGDIISEFCFVVLNRFRALSPTDAAPEGARPLDARRNGPVAGEGAGILCLETLERALDRGAEPYCEVAGWGLSAAPAPHNDWPAEARGPVLAMQRALAAAGAVPADIDYVCAAANGGINLDRLEAAALQAVFGRQDRRPWVGSIKGAVGESFSSGGMRTAAAALSVRDDVLAPTLGLDEPITPLPVATGRQRNLRVDAALVNGFSSGGTFVSLVLKKMERQP